MIPAALRLIVCHAVGQVVIVGVVRCGPHPTLPRVRSAPAACYPFSTGGADAIVLMGSALGRGVSRADSRATHQTLGMGWSVCVVVGLHEVGGDPAAVGHIHALFSCPFPNRLGPLPVGT